MCKCNPNLRTPFCGRGNCTWPKPAGTRAEFSEQNDCEDQGFGLVSDGCACCATWVGGTRYPHPLVVIDGFWRCEGCNGSYGPAEVKVGQT